MTIKIKEKVIMNIAQVKKQFAINYLYVFHFAVYYIVLTLPAIILMIPSFASLWINNEKVHVILVLFAVPISYLQWLSL